MAPAPGGRFRDTFLFTVKLMLCLLLLLAAADGGASAQQREFVQAKILGQPAAAPVRPHMMPSLKRGRLQMNRIRGTRPAHQGSRGSSGA